MVRFFRSSQSTGIGRYEPDSGTALEEEPTSASKALAASLSSRARQGEGAGNASFRDGLLRVSGIDAGGCLDLQGLLSGLKEGLATQVRQVRQDGVIPPQEPPAAGASSSQASRAQKAPEPKARRKRR
ncbi:unnamed protein product [Effrenium voratum]|nr:unnamed protein product [Effrenium voratum]